MGRCRGCALNADRQPVIESARIAIPALTLRGVGMWVASRVIFASVQLAGSMSPLDYPPPPAAIILLAGALGLFDVRVRGERLFWANLGVGPAVLCASHAAAAAACEAALALAWR